MSVTPVSSNVHGQLDAQIAQLIQCKPLPELEVWPFLLFPLFCCGSFLQQIADFVLLSLFFERDISVLSFFKALGHLHVIAKE